MPFSTKKSCQNQQRTVGNQRKVYSEKFKKEAIGLSLRPDKMIKEIADNSGINANVLTRWRREYRIGGSLAFPGR